MTLFQTMTKQMFVAFAGMVVLFSVPPAGAGDRLAEELARGGRVLMIRHALAPGTGDPADFTIGDCSTQRNLSDRGRAQARDIGRWLREQGVAAARIYSSQWCRCLETARLIGLGPVEELPALNSFYQRPEDRGPNLAALRDFLSMQPADGELLLLVTHFVTVSAIAGEGVSSGEGVVLRLDGKGGYDVLGRMEFGS
jgi:phosphohistidine phosphatase SixA